MIRRVIFLFIILSTSCVQEIVEPIPTDTSNIFSQKETIVLDSEEISFELDKDGSYFISLIDVETNLLLTKEKIIGIKGINKLNIYTKSIESRYLYLVLTDINKVEINRTKVIFK